MLSLRVAARAGNRFVPYVRRHLRLAHAAIRPAVRELSVVFVGDTEMSRLHERFMGIAGPTDVLTFPIDQDDRGRVVSGEIVLCVPEARRQAALRNTRVDRELLLYALHGLLHLSGFDDRTPGAFAKMHRKEDEILTLLGIGAVFAPATANHRDRQRNGER